MAQFRRIEPSSSTAAVIEKYASDGIVKDIAILSIEDTQLKLDGDLRKKFEGYIKKLATEKEIKPSGIIEDAARIKEFHFFPDSIISKLKTILNTNQDLKKTLTVAQGVICEGKKPQFSPSYQVRLIIPKPPKGIPLDEAADIRKNYIESARNYLKENFFRSGSSRPLPRVQISSSNYAEIPILGGFFNDDYRSCFYEKFTDTDGEFKSSVIDSNSSQFRRSIEGLQIPLSTSFSKNEIESFYKEVRIDSSRVSQKKFPPFFSIVFPLEKSMLLVPKATFILDIKGRDVRSDFARISREGGHYEFIDKNGKARNVMRNIGSNQFYTPSEYGWQVNEKNPGEDPPFYPLLLATTSDISFLEDNFTFMFPKEIIYQINSQEKYGLDNWGYADGYNREESKFSAEKAVERRRFMWKDILTNQTSIKEAVQEDGSIVFELGLDMNLFCQYGVPVTDLLSQ